ncbi:MAG: ATP-binding protein [Nanoarchaeota archaeon]
MDLLDIRKQNLWWETKERINEDPKIRDYLSARIKWAPRLKKYIFLDKDVVYSIRGPRQVGKTTLIKIIIRELLESNGPLNIMYFACDLLRDNLALSDLLNTYYDWIRPQNNQRLFIFLDEISSVKDWQKSIKLFIDTKGNNNLTIILTGSHTLDIKSSAERLPGRIGEKEHVPTHKILLPMKFAEYVEMRNPELYKQVKELKLDIAEERMKQFKEMITGKIPPSAQNLIRLLPELDFLLDEYLVTGGIMVAVNEYTEHKRINSHIYEMYIRQLIGDMARINREERTAKLILAAMLKRIGSVYSWSSIKKDAGIPTQPTVDQYAGILQTMFVLNIYYKIELDGTIKRASDKKVYVLNPFIFHALYSWLINPAQDSYLSSIEFLSKSENKSTLIESIVGDHLNRAAHNLRPTNMFDPSDFIFYLKTNKGYEVDFIFKAQDIFTGIEVKYQNTLNTGDFKGLNKVGKGCLVTKKDFVQKEKFALIPVSLFLLYI